MGFFRRERGNSAAVWKTIDEVKRWGGGNGGKIKGDRHKVSRGRSRSKKGVKQVSGTLKGIRRDGDRGAL